MGITVSSTTIPPPTTEQVDTTLSAPPLQQQQPSPPPRPQLVAPLAIPHTKASLRKSLSSSTSSACSDNPLQPDVPQRRYLCARDLPSLHDEHNDNEVVLYAPRHQQPPHGVDLSATLHTDVPDDGTLYGCSAATAMATIYDACRLLHTSCKGSPARAAPTSSRLLLYYTMRERCGTTRADTGGSLREAAQALHELTGLCHEAVHPFYTCAHTCEPSLDAYEAAFCALPVVTSKLPSNDVHVLKRVLSVERRPIACSICVYTSFENAVTTQTGTVCLPHANETCLGAHAVVLVGYNDDTQEVLFRNCYGADWGNEGYGTLPYAYLADPSLAMDFWVVGDETAEAHLKVE